MVEPHLTRRQREDPLIIAWLRVQQWTEKNARLLATVGIAILVVIVAVLLWSRAKAGAEAKASESIAQLNALYWQGQYDRVVQGADETRKTYPGTWAATDALRLKGDALFWNGDFKGAATAYEAWLKLNREPSPIRMGVRLNLAQAYESEHQFRPAAQIYEELAKEPAPRLVTAECLLGAGRAWRAAGDSARAIAAFQKVSTQYSETPFAANADVALGEMELKGP